MTSIKEWQDSIREVDGWDEAADLMDEDDVKRWNEDKKLNPQKFKSALAMTVTSDSMRTYLFADNVWLRAHAETLQGKAPKQESMQGELTTAPFPRSHSRDRPLNRHDPSWPCEQTRRFTKLTAHCAIEPQCDRRKA